MDDLDSSKEKFSTDTTLEHILASFPIPYDGKGAKKPYTTTPANRLLVKQIMDLMLHDQTAASYCLEMILDHFRKLQDNPLSSSPTPFATPATKSRMKPTSQYESTCLIKRENGSEELIRRRRSKTNNGRNTTKSLATFSPTLGSPSIQSEDSDQSENEPLPACKPAEIPASLRILHPSAFFNICSSEDESDAKKQKSLEEIESEYFPSSIPLLTSTPPVFTPGREQSPTSSTPVLSTVRNGLFRIHSFIGLHIWFILSIYALIVFGPCIKR